MNKCFLGTGFLSETGKSLLLEVMSELQNVMSSDLVNQMTIADLRVLGANLSNMMSDAVSKKIAQKLQLEKHLNNLSDDEFISGLIEGYGNNWNIWTLKEEEQQRLKMVKK
jgi:hypothetical protein